MRIKKLMNDSFYVNSQNFSGVTSVDSLTSDLYFHFTDTNNSIWKLSGNTVDSKSVIILENSYTTAITALLNSLTGITQYTGSTYYTLSVVNQNGVNVKQEIINSSGITTSNSAVTSFNASYNVSVIQTGTTNVVVTHPDIPLASTTIPVIGIWPGPVRLYPSVNNAPAQSVSGITGTTLQFSLTAAGGAVITTQAVWTISATGITINASSGLVTITAGAVSQTATVTATYGTGTGSAYMPSTTLTVYGT